MACCEEEDGGTGWENAHAGRIPGLLVATDALRRAPLQPPPFSLSPLPPLSPLPAARLVRTESVPCDINNPLRKPPRYSDLHVSQTLPKTNKLNKVSSAARSPDPCPAATEALLLPRCPTSLLHTPKGESPKSWWLLLGLQPPLVWIHPRAIPLLPQLAPVCVLSRSIRPLCYAALKAILKGRN